MNKSRGAGGDLGGKGAPRDRFTSAEGQDRKEVFLFDHYIGRFVEDGKEKTGSQ